MAEEEKDKSEPASPFKLKEAKKKGQVAKSLEVNSFFAIAGFMLVMYMSGTELIYSDLFVNKNIFEHAHTVNFEPSRLIDWAGGVMRSLFHVFAPLIGVLLLVAVVANLVQVGPVFSPHPLKPDLNRINPVSGFKRLFSIKLLFEAVKSIIKLSLFGGILYFAIKGSIPQLLGLMQMDPDYYPVQLIALVLGIILKIMFGLIIIALLDLIYTRWDFSNKMKMSRREMKEEVKRREGDPHLRAKVRELQREAAKQRESLNKVPDADVLITNPTHLSIALSYKRDEMSAPKVLSKGAGYMAMRMRVIARQHNIPVIEDKKLARMLYRERNVDEPVKEKHFPLVAKIFAKVYAIKERQDKVMVNT